MTLPDGSTQPRLGVHSEVGKLRTVIVHRPGLEMRRLTPSNTHELLFDDVPWATRAAEEHDAFVHLMRSDYDINVLLVHELLEEVLDDPAGRAYVLDRKLIANEVGVNGVPEMRAWMDSLDSNSLVRHLIGGVTVGELPSDFRSWASRAYGDHEFVLPPLPNQLFTRDSSSWIYDGVTINHKYSPARRKETLHLAAIYKHHPMFKDEEFTIWWGDPPELDRGSATIEGGDVMPVGNGIVLVGMGERTTYQAVSQVAKALFDHGAATRVIAAKMPKDRASMHLDTVFTFCDRDLATVYQPVVDTIQPISYYPSDSGVDVVIEERGWIDVVSDALGIDEL
ncbi:MAG: arginine deiminase family protein, partial [Acidimicrobiia bacterium]